MIRRALAAAATTTALLSLTLLSACGSGSTSTGATTTGGDGPVRVVASTDVYGSIVSAIGGSDVQVTSIITDPDRDPHSYEADAQNQLALSRAALVVENGAGYDDFMETLLKAREVPGRTVIDVADVSGYDQQPADGEFNEHLWYDFPTMVKLTSRISTELAAKAPADRATFEQNARAFTAKLERLEAREATIKKAHDGAGVAITEPVPLYLLEACGLDNKTPEAFSEAIEEERDVAPAVLRQTLALFSGRQVKLLAYNAQTTGPQTEQVLAAAKAGGVAVVPVTETLPEGQDYLDWMGANLDAVERALG